MTDEEIWEYFCSLPKYRDCGRRNVISVFREAERSTTALLAAKDVEIAGLTARVSDLEVIHASRPRTAPEAELDARWQELVRMHDDQMRRAQSAERERDGLRESNATVSRAAEEMQRWCERQVNDALFERDEARRERDEAVVLLRWLLDREEEHRCRVSFILGGDADNMYSDGRALLSRLEANKRES